MARYLSSAPFDVATPSVFNEARAKTLRKSVFDRARVGGRARGGHRSSSRRRFSSSSSRRGQCAPSACSCCSWLLISSRHALCRSSNSPSRSQSEAAISRCVMMCRNDGRFFGFALLQRRRRLERQQGSRGYGATITMFLKINYYFLKTL